MLERLPSEQHLCSASRTYIARYEGDQRLLAKSDLARANLGRYLPAVGVAQCSLKWISAWIGGKERRSHGSCFLLRISEEHFNRNTGITRTFAAEHPYCSLIYIDYSLGDRINQNDRIICCAEQGAQAAQLLINAMSSRDVPVNDRDMVGCAREARYTRFDPMLYRRSSAGIFDCEVVTAASEYRA
jgi:hypothetical protein